MLVLLRCFWLWVHYTHSCFERSCSRVRQLIKLCIYLPPGWLNKQKPVRHEGKACGQRIGCRAWVEMQTCKLEMQTSSISLYWTKIIWYFIHNLNSELSPFKKSFCILSNANVLSAMGERIYMLEMKTVLFFPFLPLPARVLLFSVGHLVWEEKDPEAEVGAEGTEGRHLYALLSEQRKMEQKNYEVPEFQKKKKNRKTKIICTFSSLYLTFYLCVCVFPYWWNL